MSLQGILFDLDGTLIATNELHVESWLAALEVFDHRVGRDLVEGEIGKGGDVLVSTLLGALVDQSEGDAIRKRRGEEYEKRARKTGISWLPGAKELVLEARSRGLRTALATGSTASDLKLVEELLGVSLNDLFDAVCGSDDAQPSKPAPSIPVAACHKLSLDPLQCAFVGDSIFDATAAARAGIASIGLTTGFASATHLVENGARYIVDNAEALLLHWDEALAACSRTRVSLDISTLERLMVDALELAERAGIADSIPVGAAVFDADGQRIAVGRDESETSQDPTQHAPMVALRRAFAEKRGVPSILVSTVEPCVMCLGAAAVARIDVFVHALPSPSQGVRRVLPPRDLDRPLPRVRGGVAQELAGDLGGNLLKKALTASGEA